MIIDYFLCTRIMLRLNSNTSLNDASCFNFAEALLSTSIFIYNPIYWDYKENKKMRTTWILI